MLECSRCAVKHPIVRGIPRFVPQENYAATFGHQWARYARLQLDSQNQTTFSRDRFYSITEWRPSALSGKLVLYAKRDALLEELRRLRGQLVGQAGGDGNRRGWG